MDNHDQTKLEIAAAADDTALRIECEDRYGEVSNAVSKAFREFATEIRNRVSEGTLS